jgi:hypothetical protein
VEWRFRYQGYGRWCLVSGYGTIGAMDTHRIRLTDGDIALIVAALRARAAMSGELRRHRIERLASRLAEGVRGNPKWILGEDEQTHEEDLEDVG